MPRGRAALSLRASRELPTTLAPVKQPRRRFTPAAKALRSFRRRHGARLACSATARWSPSHVFLQVVEADVFGTAAVGVGTPPPRRAPRQGSEAGRDPECGLGACALVAGEQAAARWAEITKRGPRGKGGSGKLTRKDSCGVEAAVASLASEVGCVVVETETRHGPQTAGAEGRPSPLGGSVHCS